MREETAKNMVGKEASLQGSMPGTPGSKKRKIFHKSDYSSRNDRDGGSLPQDRKKKK